MNAIGGGALVISALLAAATSARVARTGPGDRRGWWLIVGSSAIWGLCGAFAVLESLAEGGVSAGAAQLHALAAVMGGAGLVLLLPPLASRFAQMRALLDGLILISSVLFCGWALVVHRAVEGGVFEAIDELVPALSSLLLVAVALVALTKPHRRSGSRWSLLAGGLVLTGLGGLWATHLAVAVSASTTLALTLLTAAGTAALVGAALSPYVAAAHEEDTVGIRLAEATAPLIPMYAAAGIAVNRTAAARLDAVLIVDGLVLAGLLAVRYIAAHIDNFRLAADIERQIIERTDVYSRRERQFRSLVQNASDVITIVDWSGVIRFQSGSGERQLGYAPADIVGHRIDELFHPDDREAMMDLVRGSPRPPQPPVVAELRMGAANGEWVLSEFSAANLLEDDAVQGVLITTRDIRQRRAMEDQLRHAALHDPLTGLGNRVLFRDRLAHAVDRARRSSDRLAVLMIDLDGFKAVNDSLGHAAGDELLVEVASRLKDSTRAADTIARMGGDEFAIILERPDEDQHLVVAQRIVNRLRAPVDVQGRPLVVQGSVGVASAVARTTNAEDLLRSADLAMYQAKSRGKGVVVEFEADMQAAAHERLEIEADLRRALHENQLVLHYQSVVELATGRVSGAEALVRWAHPKRGLMSPAYFLDVADETDLGLKLGHWVLHEACRQAKEFQDQYPTEPPLSMAVNLSSGQLASPWLVREVSEALEATGLDPSSLVLEITEGALMSDQVAVLTALSDLSDLGISLAIDDFGTGWSSLSRLRSFPVHKLKIDQSFISEITSADDEAPIVAAIVAMAHSLGLTTVAEGVETYEQLSCLGHHGCEEVQGYVIAKPVAADQFLALLARDPGELVPIEAKPATRSKREFADLIGRAAKAAVAAEVVPPALAHLQRLIQADAVYVTRISWENLDNEVLFSIADSPVPAGTYLPWHGSPDSIVVGGGQRAFPRLEEVVPDHDLVRVYGLVSYAAVPLERADGKIFGTLCAGTTAPAQIDDGVVALLDLFARLLIDHLPGSVPLEAGRPTRLIKPIGGFGSHGS